MTKYWGRIFLTLLFFFSAGTLAQKAPLSAEEAFPFSYRVVNERTVEMQWNIAPGYYLYANRINFSTTDTQAQLTPYFPKTQIKIDANQNRFAVYGHKLIIPVTFVTTGKSLPLQVNYQGCSERGFCYPPLQQTMVLDTMAMGTSPHQMTGVEAQPSLSTLLTDQNSIKSLLASQSRAVSLLFFLGLGLLLAFTPCILPMIPILTGIIIGQKKGTSHTHAFFLSLTYVVGAALTYALAGILAAAMGSAIQIWLQIPVVIAFVSAIFALLAASLFGFYDLNLPSRWQTRLSHLSYQQRSGSYVGVFFMGTLSSLVVSPCVTAPLIGVLIYIGDQGNLMFGASALFMLGMGMGLPLLLVGMSADRFLPKRGPWMEVIKKLFGFVMLAMAVWLLSRIMTPAVITLLWLLLLSTLTIFLWIYLPRLLGHQILARTLSTAVLMVSVLVALGTLGISNPLTNVSNQAEPLKFTVVKTPEDVNYRLSLASKVHKPVILDFYADWCESCLSMERDVFTQPEVRDKLSQFIVLRVDLTQLTPADDILLKKFKVFAPPTLLFFTPHGEEIPTNRIVGEVNTKEFISRLDVGLKSSSDHHDETAL